MNVLYMVSWYCSATDNNPSESFHTIAALDLAKRPGVNVALYYPYERNIDEPVVVTNEWGLKTYRSRYKLEDKVRNRVNMYKAMKQIVKEFAPDIIHAHVATEAGRFAVVLGKIFHIPVIITEHSSADLSGVRSFPHHQYAYMSYGGSKYNACVSDKLTDDLRKIFPRYSFETIYNGIRPVTVEKTNTDIRVIDKINMCMVAGMYDRNIKGIPVLLSALSLLKKDGIQFVCHFIGDGDYREEFERLAKELELEDVTIFHGRKSQKEVYESVSAMDFLISASRYESFGCTMAEAAMVGTPILATDSGGSASIVNDINGILLQEYDANAIYNGIKKMIGRIGTFDNEAIKADALRRFAVNEITDKYMSVYERVLNEKN